MRNAIPIGHSIFSTLRAENLRYVDKTAFIRPVIESDRTVRLITRPRRFGKTLFMTMLSSFLALNPKRPDDLSLQKRLFEGLAVHEDADLCRRHMGRHPVLFLSLKDVTGSDFESAYAMLLDLIADRARRFHHLTGSPRLEETEREALEKLCRLYLAGALPDRKAAESCLKDLLTLIAKHYGRPAVLLVDEYDTPLAWAAEHGYYEEMSGFLRGLFDFLKPESCPKLESGLPILAKAVFTGCLNTGKESIFCGLQDLEVDTIASDDPPLAAAIGFTQAETDALLDDCGLEERAGDVRAWYEGFRIGSQTVFSPWDVANFCDEALGSSDPKTFRPKRYWCEASANGVIDDLLEALTSEDADRLQTLVDGREVELPIRTELSHADLALRRPADLWTLLFLTGYLTVATSEEKGGKREDRKRLRITNRTVLETFRDHIRRRYDRYGTTFAPEGIRFVEKAFAGDAAGMETVLATLLQTYVSLRETPPESPSDDFLSVVCRSVGDRICNFRSTSDGENGLFEIVFRPLCRPTEGVLIKASRIGPDEHMEQAAEEALRRIGAERCDGLFERMGCSRYRTYGIVLQGRNVRVVGGEERNTAWQELFER